VRLFERTPPGPAPQKAMNDKAKGCRRRPSGRPSRSYPLEALAVRAALRFGGVGLLRVVHLVLETYLRLLGTTADPGYNTHGQRMAVSGVERSM